MKLVHIEIYAEIEGKENSVNGLLDELKNGSIFSIEEEELTKRQMLLEGIEIS